MLGLCHNVNSRMGHGHFVTVFPLRAIEKKKGNREGGREREGIGRERIE